MLTVVVGSGCAREGNVPCDGDFRPDLGELCDDGNSSDGDGCDCATRAIALTPLPASTAAPQVIVEDGSWCWFQDERAIIDHDEAGRERIIVASMSHGGDVQVSSLVVGTSARTLAQLNVRMERDDHDTPSLLELPDGRIAAYYTRHDGFPHLDTQFSQPLDVRSWGRKTRRDFDYDVTYTNPFLLSDGRLLMFLRGIDTNPTLVYSKDDGRTWSDGAQLLNAGERGYDGRVFDHRPYVKYAADGDQIHLLYTDGHPAEFRRNSIYHLIYRDGALWKSDNATRVASAGPDDQPQLDPSQGTLVYDGTALPGGQAWTWDAAIDAEGNPVTVFSTFPDPDPSRWFYDHQYRYATWSGGAWHIHTIAYAGTGIYRAEGFYSGGIALDPDGPNIVYFASNVDPYTGAQTTSGVFEIYRGITSDDGATWSIAPVTTGSRVSNLRPIVPAHHGAKTTLLWLRGSYDTYLDFHTEVVALVGDELAGTVAPTRLGPRLPVVARFDLAATVDGPATPAAPGFVNAVPAAGFALAQDHGVRLLVSNITGTRLTASADPLYRGLVYCDHGGYEPGDKLRIDLGGLEPNTDYLIRIHGHDTADAYTKPTLWFRGDATTLDSENNAAFLSGHRNVNNTVAGEGYTDVPMRSDGAGRFSLVGRGLDYADNEHVAVLSAVEVLKPPPTTLIARFDVGEPGGPVASDAAALTFDDSIEWAGEATMHGIKARVTTDRIDSLRTRSSEDPMLADFVFGRDQLVVDVSGLEPGRLYAITVYSTDLDENQYAASRWRLDEPGYEPIVVHGFHMNLHRKDEGASFTFYHRASASSFRLRGDDLITSLSSNPSLVIFNGMDIRVAHETPTRHD